MRLLQAQATRRQPASLTGRRILITEARLGRRARDKRPRSPQDAPSSPTRSVERSGALSSRPPLVQRFRQLISSHP